MKRNKKLVIIKHPPQPRAAERVSEDAKVTSICYSTGMLAPCRHRLRSARRKTNEDLDGAYLHDEVCHSTRWPHFVRSQSLRKQVRFLTFSRNVEKVSVATCFVEDFFYEAERNSVRFRDVTQLRAVAFPHDRDRTFVILVKVHLHASAQNRFVQILSR